MNKKISIWLALILIAGCLAPFGQIYVDASQVVEAGLYTPHSPIRIDGNSDFAIGINGVSAGDGSSGKTRSSRVPICSWVWATAK